MLNLNYRSVNLPIILFIILKGLLPPTVHFHHLGYLFHLHPQQYYTNWPSPVTNVTPVTQDQFKASMQLRNMSYYTWNTTSSAKCPPIRTTVIFIFKSQLCLIIVNLSVTHKMLRERVLVGGISTRHMRGKNFRSLVRYLKDKLMQQRQKKLSYCSLFRLPWQRQEAREVTDWSLVKRFTTANLIDPFTLSCDITSQVLFYHNHGHQFLGDLYVIRYF